MTPTCKNGHDLTHRGALYHHPDGRAPVCRECENDRRRIWTANMTKAQKEAKRRYQLAYRAKQNQPGEWRPVLS